MACPHRLKNKGQGFDMKLNAQERVFEIVNIMVEHHADGISNKELAGILKTTEATICRDIDVMERYGWITRGGKGWRLSCEFGSISGKIIKSYQKARLALAKEEAEYIASIR